ncbi:ATP-grasp domain-containing protein [Sutcliffiella horikoshii]|uniref:ATP-grasp domain-containing protein n=1 Tax=Sutcliffiella horikoshii TaxID=79883 RepID=UPI00384DD0D9
MVNKKIMILGASILQLPAILKAKEMGLEVIAVDIDKNAIGFNHADVNINISTIDAEAVIQAAKVHKIDGIMTLASDLPMRTVAAVSEELNLVGISRETAISVTNKASMREKLKQSEVPIPYFVKIETLDEFNRAVHEFENKFIVKPADNSGSRGVILVEDKSNNKLLNDAFFHSKKYSNSGEIVLEEFMDGPEVSVETLSFEGDTHVIAITDKMTTGAPNFVEMGHSIPSKLSIETKSQINKVVSAAINALGINNGPTHTEIIVTQEGPKIVELGARLGGDNITTHLVPLATGVNMVESCIQIALGYTPKVNVIDSMGSAIRYFNTSEGRINKIIGEQKAKQLPGIQEIYFTKDIGFEMQGIKSSTDRIGFIIAQGKDSADAIAACEKALNTIKIITDQH